MKHWDPIGVAGVESAADEYDKYVGHVGRMLREGGSPREIADYLHYIRTDWMGLGEQRGEDADVAALLVAWYEGATRT